MQTAFGCSAGSYSCSQVARDACVDNEGSDNDEGSGNMVIASVVVCSNYVVRYHFLSVFLNVHILHAVLRYFGTFGIIINTGLSQYGLVQVATASLVGSLCARWGAVTPARVHYQAPSYGVVPHLVGSCRARHADEQGGHGRHAQHDLHKSSRGGRLRGH